MEPRPKSGLRRDLGVWGAASIVVGIMIGTGILLVPRTMTLSAGSPVLVLAVWVVGGLLTSRARILRTETKRQPMP